MSLRFRFAFFVVLGCLFFGPRTAHAEPGDTLWVQTWQEDFINWASAHEATFTFPDESTSYEKVVLFFTIACPEAPGDCDPWDRLGFTRILHDTGEVDENEEPIIQPLEIARYVTPYDITGGTRPGSCSWEIDVSDYMNYLRGEVTLSNYIESWIGGDRGWLCTLDFAFIEGVAEFEAVKIVDLWAGYHVVYGDPNQPIEDFLAPRVVDVPADADRVKFRMFATGHGQGNSGNCAEFCPRQHSVIVNSNSWAHTLWRSDCETNVCSPQGGTWPLDRAGWCPGDYAPAWDVDVTSAVIPGTTADIDYDVAPYTNYCCPCNPDCISGVTCADCNYNNNGHTEPNYALSGQLVFYKENPVASVDPRSAGKLPLLRQNQPNPFEPATTIGYELAEAGKVRLLIYDASGRAVREYQRDHSVGGEHQLVWDGTDEQGARLPAGAYFYELQADGVTSAKKMLMLR